MTQKERIIEACHELLAAKQNGLLGECVMPEDTGPQFTRGEEGRLAYLRQRRLRC